MKHLNEHPAREVLARFLCYVNLRKHMPEHAGNYISSQYLCLLNRIVRQNCLSTSLLIMIPTWTGRSRVHAWKSQNSEFRTWSRTWWVFVFVVICERWLVWILFSATFTNSSSYGLQNSNGSFEDQRAFNTLQIELCGFIWDDTSNSGKGLLCRLRWTASFTRCRGESIEFHFYYKHSSTHCF